jgi:zinc transporter
LLGKIRRSSIRLSRQIAIGLSLIHRMEYENERSASLPPRFATARLGQRLDWLNTEIIAARERAHVLQEEAMLKTADQTNRHLQVLAIVATIFLPASLIAGIFGMNVKGLPLTAEGNGFLWSMALLVGASALGFWLLRRSGILEQ